MFDYLRQFHTISDPDYQLLSENLHLKKFKKGDFLVKPGQIQRDLFFIVSGVQVSYFESERKAHVVAFTYHPSLCAIPDSFSFQTPSKYSLLCLTDSEVECIGYNALQQLFDKSQGIERLFRKMTEVILAGMINRHLELHSLTIAERYMAFCRRSPHLLQLVQHKYIASYLGIDSTNFSKLFNTVKF